MFNLYALNTQLIALPSLHKYLLAVAGLSVAAFSLSIQLLPHAAEPLATAVEARLHAPHLPKHSEVLARLRVTYTREISRSGVGEVKVFLQLPFPHGLDPVKTKSPTFELSGPGVEVAPASKREFAIAELITKSERDTGLDWTWSFKVK